MSREDRNRQLNAEGGGQNLDEKLATQEEQAIQLAAADVLSREGPSHTQGDIPIVLGNVSIVIEEASAFYSQTASYQTAELENEANRQRDEMLAAQENRQLAALEIPTIEGFAGNMIRASRIVKKAMNVSIDTVSSGTISYPIQEQENVANQQHEELILTLQGSQDQYTHLAARQILSMEGTSQIQDDMEKISADNVENAMKEEGNASPVTKEKEESCQPQKLEDGTIRINETRHELMEPPFVAEVLMEWGEYTTGRNEGPAAFPEGEFQENKEEVENKEVIGNIENENSNVPATAEDEIPSEFMVLVNEESRRDTTPVNKVFVNRDEASACCSLQDDVVSFHPPEEHYEAEQQTQDQSGENEEQPDSCCSKLDASIEPQADGSELDDDMKALKEKHDELEFKLDELREKMSHLVFSNFCLELEISTEKEDHEAAMENKLSELNRVHGTTSEMVEELEEELEIEKTKKQDLINAVNDLTRKVKKRLAVIKEARTVPTRSLEMKITLTSTLMMDAKENLERLMRESPNEAIEELKEKIKLAERGRGEAQHYVNLADAHGKTAQRKLTETLSAKLAADAMRVQTRLEIVVLKHYVNYHGIMMPGTMNAYFKSLRNWKILCSENQEIERKLIDLHDEIKFMAAQLMEFKLQRIIEPDAVVYELLKLLLENKIEYISQLLKKESSKYTAVTNEFLAAQRCFALSALTLQQLKKKEYADAKKIQALDLAINAYKSELGVKLKEEFSHKVQCVELQERLQVVMESVAKMRENSQE